MPIEAGQQLLHYRLIEKIGEGGMGVVWEAEDTTLNRRVAIKLLPAAFSEDPERLARFEREAKLLASLNHVNIAGIYGIHRADAGADTVHFLAMELIEGEDLAQRLERGALSRDDALEIALQVAHALEAAHEAGVIHRDLKPANIKLTPNGQVKVLDFGLAKALAGDPSDAGASPSMSPTITSAGTVAGMILGTAAYMSPEQAKGKQVDRRSDIWSFGVVLHEMLSGRRLFAGESISETLAAVILKDLDWSGLPAHTPRAIRRLLRRCLQRDPLSRLRDMGEARIAIEEAKRNPDDVETDAPAAARPLWATLLPWAVAAAAVAALGWVWLTDDGEHASPRVMRFTLAVADDQPMQPHSMPTMAISPDGRRFVYMGNLDETRPLFLREIDTDQAVELDGTDRAENPFFSPDGQWIGFAADGKLQKVSIRGGPPIELCDARAMRGASWGADGTIVFAPKIGGGLMRVSDDGGEPEGLTRIGLKADETLNAPSDRWPQFLPDGDTVIFTRTENNSDYSRAEIVALSLADMSVKTLVTGGTFGRFVPPGFLVYTRSSTMFAVRFDPRTLEVTGSAVPVIDDLAGALGFGSSQFVVSDDGMLLYLGGGVGREARQLIWVDRDGDERPASALERVYEFHSVSPDGKYVALVIPNDATGSRDIWILEVERDTLTRFTFHQRWDTAPRWSPDGRWIAFASTRGDGPFNLYRKRSDGTGEVERLTTSDNVQFAGSWSPDGTVLAFTEFTEERGHDLMLSRPGGEPEVEVFLATPFGEGQPSISPDGRWMAYLSDASGQPEVYVRPLAGEGRQVQVSTAGAGDCAWSPDGTELFYRSPSREMMAVRFTVDSGEFRPALPEVLFAIDPAHLGPIDVSPDGRRFLAHREPGGPGARSDQPVVVLNWTEELKQRLESR